MNKREKIRRKSKLLLAAVAVLMLFSTVFAFGAGAPAQTGGKEGEVASLPVMEAEPAQVVVGDAAATTVEGADSSGASRVTAKIKANLEGKTGGSATQPTAAREPSPAPDPTTAASDLNPPANLEGVFVPQTDISYIQLTWIANNDPKLILCYIIYRWQSGGTPQAYDIAFTTSYQDTEIVLGTTYNYYVTALDYRFQETKPSNTVTVEAKKPYKPKPPTGLSAGYLDPGVGVDWDAHSDPYVIGYNVYVANSQGGRRTKLNTGGLVTATNYFHSSGVAGKWYAVTAVNGFGRESDPAWTQAVTISPVYVEAEDPQVIASGYWKEENYKGPHNGKIRVSDETGARLTFTFTGRKVKVYVATYWSLGNARFYLDGQLVGTFLEFSAETKYMVVALTQSGLALKSHTLVVELVGSGNPQYPYNFINVDCFQIW